MRGTGAIQRERDVAFKPCGREVELNLGIEIGAQRALEQQSAEAAAFGRLHRGTADFTPADAQLAVGRGAPGHVEAAILAGEGAILRGIRRQFVECHAEADGALRAELNLRPGDLDVAALVAVGRCFVGEQHPQRDAGPACFGEPAMGLRQRTYAPLERAMRLLGRAALGERSEEHTSELQSPYLISYARLCMKK